MRCVVLTLAGMAAAALAVAALVVGLGLYNVSAAAGHLPGIAWLLHATYHNSVELRAPLESEVPPLTDDMAAIGARHFEGSCRFCHSAPGEPRWATARAMEPAPPPIREAAAKWEARHLFWIVLNGVKMTGMPHWPAPERRDEAWIMAAFLDRVRTMTAAEYRALVQPPAADDALVAYCAMCHGLDGAGRGNAWMPRLDILGAPYIAASLASYRDGLRQSGIMQQAASRLADREIQALADRFGRKAPPAPQLAGPSAGPRAAPPETLVAAGRALAFGAPDGSDTPACRACHGPWPTQRSALFPTLVGQRAGYIARQLTLWKEGHRGGTPRAHLMHRVAAELDARAIDALAAFYAAGAPGE